jgi:peptidoglycan/xylan/chitin deacetylase (PgdA/CDA1 family)
MAISLIIAGRLTMVPEADTAPAPLRGPESARQSAQDPETVVTAPVLRATIDDLPASKPRLQVAGQPEPGAAPTEDALWLHQELIPLPAAETVTPDVPREPLLPPPDGVERVARVPIVMYHYISEAPPESDRIRKNLSIPPQLFEQHLQYLKGHGYATVSLHQLLLHLTRGEPLPANPIILTFDDGYRDNYENAFPLLQKYGYTATFFLITNFIDEGRPSYLTWEQVKALAEAGNEIGAHSRDHPDLRGRDIDFLVWQILGAKEAIQNGAGITPRFFSYPSGKYDENVVKVLASAHYWGAVTVKQGVEQSSQRPLELERIRIDGSYGADELDWLLTYYLQP